MVVLDHAPLTGQRGCPVREAAGTGTHATGAAATRHHRGSELAVGCVGCRYRTAWVKPQRPGGLHVGALGAGHMFGPSRRQRWPALWTTTSSRPASSMTVAIAASADLGSPSHGVLAESGK